MRFKSLKPSGKWGVSIKVLESGHFKNVAMVFTCQIVDFKKPNCQDGMNSYVRPMVETLFSPR